MVELKREYRKGLFIKMENDKATVNETFNKYECDIAVYTVIKSYMNKDTYECFPSYETIGKTLGLGKNRVSEAVQRLIACKELKVRKDGRKNVYCFPLEKDNWKKINYEFIDLPPDQLSADEKGFIITLRQFFFENTNTIKLTANMLAGRMGVSYYTLTRRLNSLIEKGFITRDQIHLKDSSAKKYLYKFDMEKLKLDLDVVKREMKEVKAAVVNQDDRLTVVEKELAELKALLKKQK
jgi:predicted transcriptional regulator